MMTPFTIDVFNKKIETPALGFPALEPGMGFYFFSEKK